jgi:hypothetical protein
MFVALARSRLRITSAYTPYPAFYSLRIITLKGMLSNVIKLSAPWQDKPLAERSCWLSGVEASKIATTPLSERINLTALGCYPFFVED